jgi:hypothetical protein
VIAFALIGRFSPFSTFKHFQYYSVAPKSNILSTVSKAQIVLNQQMSQLLASFSIMSTELQSSEEARSDFKSSATNLATTPLTLMRLPPELRHRIYDFVWNEDITIDLLLYAQPLLGGRYNEVRGGIRPQRLIYNSLQLIRKGKGGFRGDVHTITALRVCKEFWREGLSRGRFHLDGESDDLQTFLWLKSSKPYFPLIHRLSLYHPVREETNPYHEVSHRLHGAAEVFRNLRDLDLSIDEQPARYGTVLAIGKAVRDIVDSFPNKKPLLVVKIIDYSMGADMRPNARCFMHGLDPFTMTTFRGSESLFGMQSPKAFPRLQRVTVRGYESDYAREAIRRYEYKGWSFEQKYVTTTAGVGDASLWSDVFLRRLCAPIWVYTLKER